MTNKFKHISEEEMERRFMTFLENTKDCQLTTEEQKAYAKSFYKYMQTEKPRESSVRTSLTLHPGEKLKRAIGYVTIAILFAMLLFSSIAGVLIFRSDLDLAAKIIYPCLLGIVLVIVLASTGLIFGSLSKNLAKFAGSRKIKVGDMYFYDVNCKAGSSLMYSPIIVQIIDILDNGNVLGVSSTNGQYIAISDPSLLLPFKKSTAEQMENHCMIRLPANMPIILEDDLTVLDACIVNAKNYKQDQLVNCLLDLKSRLIRYAFDPLCPEIAKKHDAIVALFDDITKIARKTLCNEGALNDPYIGDLARQLKSAIEDIQEAWSQSDNNPAKEIIGGFGIPEELIGNLPTPKEVQDFLRSFGNRFNDADNYDEDDDYEDDDDEYFR